jgi:hypothetical protein
MIHDLFELSLISSSTSTLLAIVELNSLQSKVDCDSEAQELEYRINCLPHMMLEFTDEFVETILNLVIADSFVGIDIESLL